MRNIIRYHKKDTVKYCNFLGLKVITNIFLTLLSTLLSLPSRSRVCFFDKNKLIQRNQIDEVKRL